MEVRRAVNFDHLARHYGWMEWLLAGRKLQRCRTALLDRVSDCRRVLMVGEGPGRFLHACRQALPEAEFTVVDASRSMLEQARRNAAPGVEFVQADAREWQPSQPYDLLSLHFFLDCFPEAQLDRVIANLAAGAESGARLLLSDFQLPSTGWGRTRAQAIQASMYSFFRIAVGLPARRWVCPDAHLRRHGFRLLDRRESEWGLLRSDLWERSEVQAATGQ